jgi:hypothetical protein
VGLGLCKCNLWRANVTRKPAAFRGIWLNGGSTHVVSGSEGALWGCLYNRSTSFPSRHDLIVRYNSFPSNHKYCLQRQVPLVLPICFINYSPTLFLAFCCCHCMLPYVCNLSLQSPVKRLQSRGTTSIWGCIQE